MDHKEIPTPRARRILSSKKTEKILIILIIVTFAFSLVLSSAVNQGREKLADNTATQETRADEYNKNLETYAQQSIVVDSVDYQTIVADTLDKRILGLSNSTSLPENVDGMLFIFDSVDSHSIWMKDMNYNIDIFWLDQDFQIVHQELNISPGTYPSQSFSSPSPALYVLELPSL
jgi:uncharacterized membrane protein (UPF0127 family)